MIDADSLRSTFLAFFAERGHAILPSASLIPKGDPSVLFTTAGVHPLVPYLLGQPHPAGKLLADCQKCLRTTDIAEVGDASHLTFFEMLGNWSLGAYFKRESITWSYELLTRGNLLAIPPRRLWISVFAGNQATPADEESAGIWRSLGIPAERIVYLSEEHNWWELGPEGPCGPDTEVFVDTTGVACQRGEARCLPATCDCGRFVEVWNNVFMTFERRGGGLLPLPQANVDTGMGLERMLTVLGGVGSVYETAPLDAIHQRIASLSPIGVEERTRSPKLVRALRILTDHLRSAVFILGDQAGVLPGNQGRGYVLRRLIRRAMRACQTLRIEPQRWAQTAELVIDRYGSVYPELPEHADRISNGIIRESERFESTLRRATAKLRREIARLRADGGDRIPAEVAFHLYDTDGLPLELTTEIAREAGFDLDVDGFERLFAQHRQRSRPQPDRSGGQAQPWEAPVPELQVQLPGGAVRQVPAGTTLAELLDTMDAVAALVDGEPWDLGRGLDRDATLAAVPAASEQGRAVLRHSAAHVLAQAVTDLYSEAKYAIGPPTEDGFYYDFDVPEPFTPEDLERIEARMRQIVAEAQPFRRLQLSRDDALRVFADQPYKREIIEATDESQGAGPTISVYANDGFVDLCRGPHVPSTAAIPAFKLLRAAGAYWRGDESRPQLQRIYGTAWESEEALARHLHRLEEAERRDHRRLGLELDLFHFPPEIGSGLPVFHPKGGLVRKLMEDHSRAEHEAAGYSFVWTPHLAKSTLFETSGHLEWYADSMFPPMQLEGAQYHLKPMNCPMHILIYRSRGRSYRELPLRLFEFGTVYRFERSGVIHGLARVRGITQDDAHIFCAREQLAGELASLLEFVLRLLRTFGLTEFEAELATRPENFVGTVEEWDQAEAALKEALDASGLDYLVAEGEGVFYAPKIDVHVRDAIGRRWQISTLQVDFQLPHRFDLGYTGADNARHRPFMIHRALFGSVERFMAIVLEHYAGALPPWLAPVQVRLVPVADRHLDYAAVVANALSAAGLRPEVDTSGGRMQAKVRDAQLAKVPYTLVLGDRDEQAGAVSVRLLDGSERRAVPLADFVQHLAATVAAKDPASLPPGSGPLGS